MFSDCDDCECKVNVACLDPDTGEVIWQRYVEPEPPVNALTSGIAVRAIANSDDVFFLYHNTAATGPTSLERISAGGRRIWKGVVSPFPETPPIFPAPFSATVPASAGIMFDVDSDGNVIVCTSFAAGITKFDGETGAVIWGPILGSTSDPDGRLIGNVKAQGTTIVVLRSFPSIPGKNNLTRVSSGGSVIDDINDGVWLRVSQPPNNFYTLDDGTLVGRLLIDQANSLIYDQVTHVDSSGVPITMSGVQPSNCFDVFGGQAIAMVASGTSRNFSRINLATGTAVGKSPSSIAWSSSGGKLPSSLRMLDTSRFVVGGCHPHVEGAFHLAAFNFDDSGSSIAPLWTTRVGRLAANPGGVGTQGVVDVCITSESQRLVACTNNYFIR